MTVEELIVYGKKYIDSTHAKMLLADILSVNPLELLTILDQQVHEKEVILYKNRVESAKKNIPIQYVIGSVNFYGEEFLINNQVLIPRFETEQLVEYVAEYIKKRPSKKLKILDLGCGSGVIGLTLKRMFQEVEVTLVDISEEAIKIAQKNGIKQQLLAHYIISDWLEKVPVEKFDIIVSNPPYIRLDEDIEDIVKDNEPSIALYGGKDGLSCYRAILSNIRPYVKEDTFIAFEIGFQQKEDLFLLVNEYLPDWNAVCKKDLQGRNRFLFVTKKID